ncbi:hypothetical protein K501DRAFT_270491 [Backusella circina FSU 941]|nr:hypothetical protein K501DRAFT_270491 [Backusella circina FSU 941]
MESLGIHINNSHVNKASTSNSTPLQIHIREPSIESTPKAIKRRRTSNEINQTIFNYTTETESVLGNNMLNAFDMSSSVMKLSSASSSSTVSVTSSKDDLDTLSLYNKQKVEVEVEVEPAEDEGDRIETKQFLSVNYVSSFLDKSRFAWLIR